MARAARGGRSLNVVEVNAVGLSAASSVHGLTPVVSHPSNGATTTWLVSGDTHEGSDPSTEFHGYGLQNK